MGGQNWSRLQKAAEGDAASVVAGYQDGEIVGYGDDNDVISRWDGSIFEFLPVTTDTGSFNIGDGTLDMDFKVFMDSTSAYFEVDQSAQLVSIIQGYLAIGLTGTKTTQTFDGTKAFSMYTTCASTDGATSYEPFLVSNTLTGAGQVGGRALFHMTANVGLGGWSNALKAHAEYGASGYTTGLGSALCAEITLSAGTTQGNYAPLESELVADSAVSTGTKTGFFYCNIGGSNGTGKTTINTNGYLFILGAGVVDTANGMFDLSDIDTPKFNAALKICVGGVDYFIGLGTDITFAD